MKLIVSKLVYWPVRIAIANQESSKGIAPTNMSSYTAKSINMQSTSTAQSTMYFPHHCYICQVGLQINAKIFCILCGRALSHL